MDGGWWMVATCSWRGVLALGPAASHELGRCVLVVHSLTSITDLRCVDQGSVLMHRARHVQISTAISEQVCHLLVPLSTVLELRACVVVVALRTSLCIMVP